MLIAEPDYTMFTLGDATFAWPLYVLFAVTTFVMEIFLLNMLIAIMGQTFSERYEVADLSKCKERLQFVMDHFHLKEYVMDTKKINYIVAAFAADDQDKD